MKNFFSINDQSEHHLERIFSLNMELLCITDIVGNFLTVNTAWESMLGYSMDELENKNLNDFVHPNDLESTRFAINELITQNDILDFSNRYYSKDKTFHNLQWQFRRYDDLIYVAARDLTEKHYLELSLQKETEENKLAAVTKNQIVSILSHEFQPPMEGLLGFIQLLEKTSLTSNQITALDSIRLSSQLLENLISGIVDFSETPTKDMNLEVISFDFYATMEDAIIPLMVSANRKKISIELFIHPKMPQYVMGHPSRLKQIISYLVSNALVLEEQGKIIVDISLEETYKSVFKVLFAVKTTGTEILEGHMHHPLNSFDKNVSERTENSESTDFGLDIAKSLVEAMHGKLSVTRDKKQGSVFSFHVLLLKDQVQKDDEKNTVPHRTLPMYSKNIQLQTEDFIAIEQLKKEYISPEDPITTKKRQCVLIVDDSPVNTKLLEQSLKENYDILIANRGKDALMIANSTTPPDIILLDVIMPEMNGYEVCKQIHLDEKTKDIPVIFLTSLTNAENEEYGLKLGAIDYITKPFSIPVVEAKIKNHLALKYYQDILKVNTDVDSLTQIANRRRFDEMLAIEVRKAKRMNTHLSLIMLDIDHFKLYNDTYGHLEGDECLRQVAFTLKLSLKRAGDLVARWGGEEFTCLLPNTDSKGAAHIAEKLRNAVMNLGIPHKSSPVEKVVTVSIGVVTAKKSDSDVDSFETMLEHVDEALYKAKESGRNQIFIYKESVIMPQNKTSDEPI